MIRSFVVTASLAASLLATTVLAQTESVSFELTNNTGFTLNLTARRSWTRRVRAPRCNKRRFAINSWHLSSA